MLDPSAAMDRSREPEHPAVLLRWGFLWTDFDVRSWADPQPLAQTESPAREDDA